MTTADWQQRYIHVSGELALLAAEHGIRTGDDASDAEGALLDELDALELTADAMIRAGTAS